MDVGGGVAEFVGALAALLLISTATLAVAKRFRFPSTVGLVVVGVVLSQLGRVGPEFLEPLHAFELPPAVVFFVLLPALVFESAFNLEGRALKENLAPVLTMAVPGLLISTGLLGALMHWTTGMSWPLALLLGTVLSATDPAGVTALFRQLGVSKRLSILVEGESLFNDATSIVASRIVLARAEGLLVAKRKTLRQIPELEEGGVFSPRVAEAMRSRAERDMQEVREALRELRTLELDREVELQTEKVHHTGNLPAYTLYPPGEERVEFFLVRALDRIPGMGSFVERIRARRTAKDFEVSWARSRATRDILRSLDEMGREESIPPAVVDEIRDSYETWHKSARERMDLTAGDFFGEMAFLHGNPRTASCLAVTPCALYELRRSDLDAVWTACPAIQRALEQADRKRSRELRAQASR